MILTVVKKKYIYRYSKHVSSGVLNKICIQKKNIYRLNMTSNLVKILSGGHFAMFLEWSYSLTSQQNIQTHLSKGNTKAAVQFLTLSTTASAIANVLSTPWIGTLLDSFGRRPVILLGHLLNFAAKLLLAFKPSFITLAINNVVFGIGCQMVRLGTAASFSDVLQGKELSHALNVFNMAMGLAMIPGSLLGARSASKLGNKMSLYLASIGSLIGFGLVFHYYKETKKETIESNKTKKTTKKTTTLNINPLAFLKVFQDARLAKLCCVNCLHYMADSTFQLDQVFLRTYVGLDNNTMGTYGMIRGISYSVGTYFSRLLLPKIGAKSYTQVANIAIIAYLYKKGTTRNMQGMMVFSFFYALAPIYIRSSGVQSLYFDRGVELGMGRGELSAISSSLINTVQIVQPFVFSSIYNNFHFKGYIYFLQAGLVGVSSILLGSI